MYERPGEFDDLHATAIYESETNIITAILRTVKMDV